MKTPKRDQKRRIDAMLKHSRKCMLQRKRKPLPKHGKETWRLETPCPYDLNNAPGFKP